MFSHLLDVLSNTLRKSSAILNFPVDMGTDTRRWGQWEDGERRDIRECKRPPDFPHTGTGVVNELKVEEPRCPKGSAVYNRNIPSIGSFDGRCVAEPPSPQRCHHGLAAVAKNALNIGVVCHYIVLARHTFPLSRTNLPFLLLWTGC